jgi:hypothetical protein
VLRIVAGILPGVTGSFLGLSEVLREPIDGLIYRDFFSRGSIRALAVLGASRKFRKSIFG